MADDPEPLAQFTHVAWAPFSERGRFRYWVECGRGTIKIKSDGTATAVLYHDRHASGGSIWTHLLPVGERPPEPTPKAKRPDRSDEAGAAEDYG